MRMPSLVLLVTSILLIAPRVSAEKPQPIRLRLLPVRVLSPAKEVQELRVLLERVLAARIQSEEGVQVIHRPDETAPPDGFTTDAARRKAVEEDARWALWGSLTKVGKLMSLDLRLLEVGKTARPASLYMQASDREKLLAKVEQEAEVILSRLLERKKVVEIRVEGNRRIGVDAILLRTRTRVGDDYSPYWVREDVREIEKMGFFDDVQAHTEDVEGGKAVIFRVKEKPTIREVVIAGNKKIDTDDIEEVVTIQAQSLLNYKTLQNTVEKIRKLYQEKGYYEAKISYELKDLQENQKGVVFHIQEGRKFWIKQIRFEGNEHFPDKKLRKIMKTKQRGLFYLITGSGVLDQETLRQDVERLSSFYYNHGFLKNRIGTPRIETKENRLYITIGVEEGDPYKIQSISLSGDLLDDEKSMKEALEIREGDYFNRSLLRKDLTRLHDQYADLGFAYAKVEPSTKIDEKSKTVDIEIHIRKNQEVHIGRIRIMGNTKTRDKVIRRELLLDEGDTFSSTALKVSNQRLRALRYFEESNITTIPGGTEDVVDVNVEVKEKQTGSFTFGAGYSSIDKVVGMAEVKQINLFGMGYKASLKAEIGGSKQFYNFQFVDPWLFDKRISMQVDAYRLEREYPDYTRASIGGDTIFYFPLDRFMPRLRGTIGYRAENVEVTDVDPTSASVFVEQEGESLTSEILGGLTYDSRDRALYPTKGSLTGLSAALAGLGGDNYFAKYIFSTAWYFPVYWDLVFMARGEAGYGHGWKGMDLPVFERFFLGGLNTIRGFKPGAVGPRDRRTDEVIGGDKELFFNFELIFPILKQLDLRGVVFYDTGNAYLGGIDMTDLRHAVGGGIRWHSPFGPLRMEIGYNLDPKRGENDYEWAFGVGGAF